MSIPDFLPARLFRLFLFLIPVGTSLPTVVLGVKEGPPFGHFGRFIHRLAVRWWE